MARKSIQLLPSRQKAAQRASWAALGADSSMTSIAVVGMGYDGMLDKLVGPFYSDMRWYPEDDYYLRLTQAARGENLVHDVLSKLWVIDPANVHIALEEPFPLGMIAHSLRTGKSWDGSWIKQQCEVAGAFKGALGRHGYTNLYEINNSQWHATLRKDGVEFINTRGMPTKEKRIAQMANKFKVKTWGMQAFGLPDFPDLVKSKSGAKIPRPESGYGAKARPVQPDDIYDAAACCAWMVDELETLGIAQ